MEVYLLLKLASVTLVGAFTILLILCWREWLKAEKLKQKLSVQGIKGPAPSFFGNLREMQKIQVKASTLLQKHSEIAAHDYSSMLFPYFEQWRKDYGTYNSHHRYMHVCVLCLLTYSLKSVASK